MKYKLMDFPKISDPRGNLTFLENPLNIPFEIKRVFLTYDVPGGFQRGGHSYKTQHELIIALSGSFDIVLKEKNQGFSTINLNRSYQGLYIPPNQWRRLENFSTNSVSLHLSSTIFNKLDYLWDRNE